MLARDVAVNAVRKEGTTRVRVLIRPKLQVFTKPADRSGAVLPQLREVTCTLNDKNVAVLTAGQNFGENGFFELELRGGQPGDAIGVAWVDAGGNKGRGSAVLK